MAYLRGNDPEVGKYRLLTANLDGTDETVLHIEPLTGVGVPSAAWSPDGKKIVYSLFAPGETRLGTVYSFDGARKRMHPIAAFKDKTILEVRWLPTKRRPMVNNNTRASVIAMGKLGFISYPSGQTRQVT